MFPSLVSGKMATFPETLHTKGYPCHLLPNIHGGLVGWVSAPEQSFSIEKVFVPLTVLWVQNFTFFSGRKRITKNVYQFVS